MLFQFQPSTVDKQNNCPRIEQDPTKKLLIASGFTKDLQLIGYNIVVSLQFVCCTQ